MGTTHNMGHMLGFTAFFTHLYLLVGNDCVRSQWFEVGGYRYKKSGEYTYRGILIVVWVQTQKSGSDRSQNAPWYANKCTQHVNMSEIVSDPPFVYK